MSTQKPIPELALVPGLVPGVTSITQPPFKFIAADAKLLSKPNPVTPAVVAPLGVLETFKGTWTGTGFNTIFRPNSGGPTSTTFPNPVTPAPPTPPSENVLELNLTTESLTFQPSLGNVPNRGLEGQAAITLNGVPYQQAINDVTNPATGKGDGIPSGIHFEPGLWMHIPATTTDPDVPESLVRMASIPHGTTINAQGYFIFFFPLGFKLMFIGWRRPPPFRMRRSLTRWILHRSSSKTGHQSPSLGI
jgi:hypothetical protein